MNPTEFETLLQDLTFLSAQNFENDDIEILINNINDRTANGDFTVHQKVRIADTILASLSREKRILLSKKIIVDQIINQRKILGSWSTITGQSAMIDTGYIGQHLVSLVTCIPGQGMRGKGDDLTDGSEVKSANFLDSLDQRGATAPRWNFTANTIYIMERFLTYDAIYLLSIDRTQNTNIRVRIWKVNIQEHDILANRYQEWMEVKGYPKFRNTDRHSVNFQLFPPKTNTNENFARHGNGRANGFPQLNIPLEDTDGSELIFHAEESITGDVEVFTFL